MSEEKKLQIITMDEFLQREDFFVKEALKNKVFVYPTDTIYGIGVVYTPQNLEKINKIKQRPLDQMCSVIAPNMDRIFENYKVQKSREELENLQNKYQKTTFIFDYKKPGVRLINHPFQNFVEKLGKPFITTSVNITQGETVVSVENIPAEIKKFVDYAVDDGVLEGHASVLVDLVKGEVVER